MSSEVEKLITFGQMALEQGWYDKAREYFEQAKSPCSEYSIDSVRTSLRAQSSVEKTLQSFIRSCLS